MAGLKKLVRHAPHHDLESFFYVLLGISMLYDEPRKLKPEDKLAECFDEYFNTFQPSLQKRSRFSRSLVGQPTSANISPLISDPSSTSSIPSVKRSSCPWPLSKAHSTLARRPSPMMTWLNASSML